MLLVECLVGLWQLNLPLINIKSEEQSGMDMIMKVVYDVRKDHKTFLFTFFGLL